MKNELKELPEEIGNLKELTWLECFANQLEYLPKSIVNLKNLDHFGFRKEDPEKHFTLTKQQIHFIRQIREHDEPEE